MGWRPATRKAPASDWIPCTVRMPESGSYLVTKKQSTGEVQVAIGNYYASGNQWSGNGNFKNVIAWMPLPEPWKGEDNGI